MKILMNILCGLFLAFIVGSLIISIINEPTPQEKKERLINQGYTPTQVDSIIKKQDDDLTYAILRMG